MFTMLKEWNKNSSLVWREIVSRWGQEAYDDEVTRAAHQITLQAEDDSQAYARSRKQEYDKLNQWEMQFDDQRDGTSTWVDSINEIKERFPK